METNSNSLFKYQARNKEWSEWVKSTTSKKGYYNVLKKANERFRGFSKESIFTGSGLAEIAMNNEARGKYYDFLSNEFFAGRPEMKELYRNVLENSTDDIIESKNGAMSSEGIFGAGNVYASSKTTFGHSGLLPFVIASYLYTCRSSEIYQIFNGKSDQLDFSYNIDVIQKDGIDYILPFAYRDGSIRGFNVLPQVKLLNVWSTATAVEDEETTSKNKTYPKNDADNGLDNSKPAADAVRFTGDRVYCNLFEEYDDGTDSAYSQIMLSKSGGIDPGILITGIVYNKAEESFDTTKLENDGKAEVVCLETIIRPTQYVGKSNERMFKFKVDLPVVADDGTGTAYRTVNFMGTVNLDSGQIDIMKGEIAGTVLSADGTKKTSESESEAGSKLPRVIGIKFDAKIQNIGNEMPTATFMTRRQECIREVTYRQYATAGLNEYMQDNFFIGQDSGVNYPAYATDHILEATMVEREIEAEDMYMDRLKHTDGVMAHDAEYYPFSPKLGGFVDKDSVFNIADFTPGTPIQTYKDAVREFIVERLSMSETYLNINRDIPHEWILLCNNLIANKLVVTKFENAVVNVQEEGANGMFGSAIDTRAGWVDNLDRKIRVIANTDIRWYNGYKNNIYGALKTHSMNMPFFVYYPYSVRMFQAIDANFPNRSAIVVGGKDLRDCWTSGLYKLQVEGAMAQGTTVPTNVFASQIANSKEFKITSPTGAPLVVSAAESAPVYTKATT